MPDNPSPKLTAEQYTRADDLYWKVMARCCIRKPGAAKIHQQIERQVFEGKSDAAILADFSARYGGGPVNLDHAARDSDADWMLAIPLASGSILAAAWVIRRRMRLDKARA